MELNFKSFCSRIRKGTKKHFTFENNREEYDFYLAECDDDRRVIEATFDGDEVIYTVYEYGVDDDGHSIEGDDLGERDMVYYDGCNLTDAIKSFNKGSLRDNPNRPYEYIR